MLDLQRVLKQGLLLVCTLGEVHVKLSTSAITSVFVFFTRIVNKFVHFEIFVASNTYIPILP